jgi:hypothetical protein
MNRTKKHNYQYLIGKSKDQIVKEMEEEFNFYPSDIWTYILATTWFGRKKVLIIFFNDEDIVIKVFIKNVYGKIKVDEIIKEIQ